MGSNQKRVDDLTVKINHLKGKVGKGYTLHKMGVNIGLTGVINRIRFMEECRDKLIKEMDDASSN